MSTPTRSRRWFTTVLAAVLGVAAVLPGASPAWAAGYIYHGPGSSYGWYDFDIVDDWMHLQTQPAALGTGYCLDTILDWDPGNIHMDARLARSCRSWTIRNTQRSNENDNRDLYTVQRLGVCYGPNQATNGTGGSCKSVYGGMAGVVTKVGPTEFCIRAWSMRPNGELQFFSGGLPHDCYA